ncbi:ABC transporter substrate-binding protein [Streptomyces sp. NPDC051985]|uniref:ABC transporter substrate-binding protein n=1 Tax=Streptomyces sp. NPDC051985 TaxID=3155807 RepID=UPI00343ECEB2
MPHNRRLTAIGAMLALTATACAGSGGGSGSGGGTIEIGQIASLTGNFTPLGQNDKLGAALAVEQINAAGGVLGKKLHITVKNDESDPQQAITGFNNLVSGGAVAFVGTPVSNAALAVEPLAKQRQVPYVSTAAVDQQVQPPSPYIYMTPLTAGVVSEQLLKYFKASGMTKMAVAYDTQNAFAKTGWEDMKAKAAQYGIDFVDAETFTTTQTNFTSVLQHVRGSGAKGLMVWGTGAPAVILAKQFAAAGMGGMKLVYSHAEASSLFTEPVGAAGEGIILASSLAVIGNDLPTSGVRTAALKMAEPFQKANGSYPPGFAFDGYNAVQLIAAAIKKAGSADPKKIAAALDTMTLQTTVGTYKYTSGDHAGLGVDQVAINTIKGGHIVPTDWTTVQLKASLTP